MPTHPERPYQILRSGGLLFFTFLLPTLYALTGNAFVLRAAMIEAFLIIAPTIILATASGTLLAIALAKSKVGGRMTSMVLIAATGWVAHTPASILGSKYPHFHVVAALYVAGGAAFLGIFCTGWVLDLFGRVYVIQHQQNLTSNWPGNRSAGQSPSTAVVRTRSRNVVGGHPTN